MPRCFWMPNIQIAFSDKLQRQITNTAYYITVTNHDVSVEFIKKGEFDLRIHVASGYYSFLCKYIFVSNSNFHFKSV